jgi:hypothetical protein
LIAKKTSDVVNSKFAVYVPHLLNNLIIIIIIIIQ